MHGLASRWRNVLYGSHFIVFPNGLKKHRYGLSPKWQVWKAFLMLKILLHLCDSRSHAPADDSLSVFVVVALTHCWFAILWTISGQGPPPTMKMPGATTAGVNSQRWPMLCGLSEKEEIDSCEVDSISQWLLSRIDRMYRIILTSASPSFATHCIVRHILLLAHCPSGLAKTGDRNWS